MPVQIVAVSALTGYLKALLEEDYQLQDVWVRGEIGNYTQSGAGHRYFSLKDESASLRCVLFASRGSAYVPPLRTGMAVLVHGRLSMYESRGDLQLYVDAVEEAGVGALHLRFEQLKARLAAEGLFDEARKRPIPACPATVGVVTSATAAALRDIVRTIKLRCPLVRVLVAPSLVQGEAAAKEIAAAIALLNAQGAADVIIVARGGGSLEELWAFNEEVVARAIAGSRVPVVTGVGHETDFTIADFVADMRASTPTAAATAVVPDATTWRETVSLMRERLDQAAVQSVAQRRDTLTYTVRRLERASPSGRIADARQRVDDAAGALAQRLRHLLALRQEHVRSRAAQLHSLSPLLTLERGYAIVRTDPGGTLVRGVAQVTPGQGLAVRVADGSFAATVAIAGPRAPGSAAAMTAPGVAQEETPTAGAGRARTARRVRAQASSSMSSSARDMPEGEE